MKLYLGILLTLAAYAAKAQTPDRYTLKGVVSYYFNQNYGDKPDTGAKAYLLTADDLTTLGTSAHQLYRYQIAYASLGADPIDIKILSESAKTPKAKAAMEKRLGDKPALLAKLNEVNDSVSTVMAKLDVLQAWQAKRVTADGNGVFTKKLAPGNYYAVVVSAHRQRHTSSEMAGQFTIKEVVIKDDDVEIPVRFGF